MIPLRQGFGFNTNLIETNVLNLAVVIGVVIKVVGDSLRSLLDQRRSTILSTLQEIGKHTSELQSHSDLVCRLLLEKKKKRKKNIKKKIKNIHNIINHIT